MYVLFQYDKTNGTSLHREHTFWFLSRSFVFGMRNISDKLVDKIKTLFMVNKFCFSENGAVSE